MSGLKLCAEGQAFELEHIEIDGITVRSWKNAAANLRDFWLSTAGHGDATYLVYGDERWTYAESHEQVSRIARWLADNGVQPGDRVAIAMRNYPEWLLSYWAIVSIGAVCRRRKRLVGAGRAGLRFQRQRPCHTDL